MDLSGTWRAALADDDLRRSAIGLGYDDDAWEPVPVPGHWQRVPAFADSDGPLLYRRSFELDPPPDGRRDWVVLDGIFYQADVWLDGAYLGDPEGYFVPHGYEISELTRAGREHALAVEVACAPQRDRSAKRNVTGVFQHWDCLDPEWNPGGIWRPVRVERTGPVRIAGLRVLCRQAEPARAVVLLRADLDSDAPRSVVLRTTAAHRLEHDHEQSLAAGHNSVEWTVRLDDPPLWWPWSLGDQPLVELTVEVLVDGGASHARTVRTGLRRVSMRDWVLSVNGERLFVKGANLAPTRMALAEATPGELRRDVELAKAAGLDLVRLHAHVTRPELYDAADELGLLVWQDLPLQWGYARSVRRPAVRQARTLVDELGHHPSIVVWCGHNEPIAADLEQGRPPSATDRGRVATGMVLPTWNRSILDRWVKRSFEKADPTRPVVAHSGVPPTFPKLDGTDSHLYFGWYWGHERDLGGFAAAWPRMVRFVSEFGAQAVPEAADFCEPERWPDLDWEQLARRHGLQKWGFDRYVPPADHATFASWKEATQAYQASLLRHHVETLRRLKYRPTGGFAMFLLNDAHPAVSWSVLDHERRAKAGYHALSEACRPVIVVADRPPATLTPGQAVALDVHVVSDLHTPLTGAEVTARLAWGEGGRHGWRWRGDVPADTCVRVGTVQFVVPARPGPLLLDLDLACGDVAASNRYTATIVPS